MNFDVLHESSLITKYVYRPPDSASTAWTNITTQLDTTHQSIWIDNEWNITQNNCLQGKKIILLL